MKLTKKALSELEKSETRLKLAIALGFSENWVRSCVSKNKANGPLTTVKAMKVIKEETKLEELEILTED